ncbi:MAG: EAL domain-containing protein [Lachnospiraceae bacterium]|nr:EAL domain-containing protein [Lachnospiraceae bacterium]
MWDYSFAIPSLLITTILLVFYFSLPRLSIRMNQVFVALLVVEGLTIFFDILSSYVDTEYREFPLAFVHFMNVFYFLLFFYRVFAFFAFFASVLKMLQVWSRFFKTLLRLPFIIGTLLAVISPWTGILYIITDNGYAFGPLYDALYYITYFYCAISFLCLFLYRNNVKRRRYWYSMLLCQIVLTVGIFIRKAIPTLLLYDTFCLMTVLIVYLAFQNPEFYLEERSSVFNSKALREYLEEQNGMLMHRLVGVVVHNYHNMRDAYGGKQMDLGIGLISDYLTHTFRNCNVFYVRRGRYIILGPWDMQVEETLKTLEDRFDKPWVGDEVNLYLTASYVHMELEGSIASTDSLLNALTESLEKADRLVGSEAICISADTLKEQEKENQIKRCLEDAIMDRAVEVFFQPLVDASSGRIVGAEALARIRDKEGKIISPGLFIPIAEETGKIRELGEQVFERTCQFIHDHDLKKYGIFWVNVNISPVQFFQMDMAQCYDEILRKYDVNPKMIHLEITEEAIVDDNLLRTQIRNMQERGFDFVLDDYGTGYSNLTRLKKCSFINIKLDMSVVRDFCKEPDEILPNMVLAFKSMNFSVTAEGIEEANMEEMMREVGCDYFQGYYYSKPVPGEEFWEKVVSS